ncbi:hypothetical protein PR048_026843 [Dryococelus australis]|uniref:OTU domain-containing protein n=1 Tax=Dryococelus australis TaxID=614101 RepID=A0ABQ9GMF4_9NEOP|nr:hypothetical protein PR048_026843 [Dryococelus australis]
MASAYERDIVMASAYERDIVMASAYERDIVMTSAYERDIVMASAYERCLWSTSNMMSLNIEVLRTDEGEATLVRRSPGLQEGGKRDTRENQSTSDIAWRHSHLQKSRSDPTGNRTQDTHSNDVGHQHNSSKRHSPDRSRCRMDKVQLDLGGLQPWKDEDDKTRRNKQKSSVVSLWVLIERNTALYYISQQCEKSRDARITRQGHLVVAIKKLLQKKGVEPQTEVLFTDTEAVTVMLVGHDGDSLFGALAHQLYGVVVGSPQHHKDAAVLRAAAVKYLRDNTHAFSDHLLEAVEQRAERYANQRSSKDKMLRFLEELARPGFWPGLESIAALASLLKVMPLTYSHLVLLIHILAAG